MTGTIPGWLWGVLTALGGFSIVLALAVMRAMRQIPPAPDERDPIHAAEALRERVEVAEISHLLERDTVELEAALDIEDADQRSHELARLMAAGRRW